MRPSSHGEGPALTGRAVCLTPKPLPRGPPAPSLEAVKGASDAEAWYVRLALVLGALMTVPPSAAAPAGPARPAVEPEAVAALERMGAYLRGLPAFVVRAYTTTDEVLESGQKIQLDGVVDLRVRSPIGCASR